jgi:hypothetical protein
MVHDPSSHASSDDAMTSFEHLLRHKRESLAAFFHDVPCNAPIPGTRTNLRLHVLKSHAGQPRTRDLARLVAQVVIDYAIPRRRIGAAKNSSNPSTMEMAALFQEARDLFVDDAESGEGGEALLYFLAEALLALPQLLCKMPLKTNPRMHVHGVDGIHGTFRDDGGLSLYWGESKLYTTASKAIDACFRSLAPYLTQTGGARAPLERDLQLLNEYLDLDDPNAERLVRACLDRKSQAFLDVRYCGICLVGFDIPTYPDPTNPQDLTALMDDANAGLRAWSARISAALGTENLNDVEIELFCLPLNSVQSYREEFLRALGVTFNTTAPTTTPKTAAKSTAKKKTTPRKKKGAP